MLTFDGCDPGANPLVEKYFHDCVMDCRDGVGFVLGLCSIFVWLTAQLPQFISNIKNQSCEALSIWFLVEWFAGDTLNLLGCLIQGQQLPTTTILAAYFVIMDVIMLLQYIYYGTLQARRRRLRAKAARKRYASHRHTSSEHHHCRDDSAQQGVHLLQDCAEDAACGELSCAGVEDSSSTLPTPAEDSNQLPSDLLRAAAGAGAARFRSNLRSLATATVAAVSMVCVVALALHPRGPLSAGLNLRSLPGQEHLAVGGDFNPACIGSAGVSASSSQGLDAAGAAFSAVDGGLAAVHNPPAPLGFDGGESDVPASCSFLNCDVALVAGTTMGYLSTCFYLASRISQIRKNLQRRSTEGLSPIMFMLTMSANMCTGISIVLRLRSLEQLKEQAPWMCGTFGTIALDITLFYQAMTLGQVEQNPHHDHHHHHQRHGLHSHGHGHGRHGHHSHQAHSNVCTPGGGRGGADGGLSAKLADLEAPLLGPTTSSDGDALVASADMGVNGAGAAVCRG
ncbi:hypothetical protein PLESTB_000953000 [Pleodorina starrii]|uniref:Uncharacterized protein n=1 Tax=Pleodorina starrii TaxID=330485 RepID=A0A9W6F4B0_9CHLO|nr:hypothetical protein PLESTM_001145600 [Pleodorina starrii]GLC55186.1 hypothetical protein PLESTB_000953000 [Pleodorina starrii]GLC71060.1 hypothetical protein PLESTF_001070400 [Pleodorina starrii]